MNRIVRDYFCVSIAKIINERLFSIVNRIYDVHKHYVFEIIKTKMICRQHDQKKHEKKTKTNERIRVACRIDYIQKFCR